ncbi:hypothetical protein L596_030450 [Steinernema carpocapsae]|uniref:Peptidase S1 domain-containing protein n=1 Tax=Steinernema carpocapsae TaxID=34508 RepID=A0A4U5LPG2_STECR|nr:hypothetical protein L596_030450 [Steinernema carpocapsae]
MRAIFAVFCLLLGLFANGTYSLVLDYDENDNRVFERVHQGYPFLNYYVFIESKVNNTVLFCEGVRLTERHLVTTTPCAQNYLKSSKTVAITNHRDRRAQKDSNYKSADEVVTKVVGAKINGNLAILRVDQPMILERWTHKVFVSKQFRSSDVKEFGHSGFFALGHGFSENFFEPNLIKMADLKRVSSKTCRREWKHSHLHFTDDLVCARVPGQTLTDGFHGGAMSYFGYAPDTELIANYVYALRIAQDTSYKGQKTSEVFVKLAPYCEFLKEETEGLFTCV